MWDGALRQYGAEIARRPVVDTAAGADMIRGVPGTMLIQPFSWYHTTQDVPERMSTTRLQSAARVYASVITKVMAAA